MELKGKIAIVSRGGTGIGKATTLLFAREGAKVTLAGRREDKLLKTFHMIKDFRDEAPPCR
jgi:NAD(P)-dependent dehydrogenase (short-subunit alcohol dehydrogenase family)